MKYIPDLIYIVLMKKFAALIAILILGAISINAQQTKTLKELDESIITLETELKEKQDKYQNLIASRTESHPEVKAVIKEIADLKILLASHQQQKKVLVLAQWLKTLPNNQIELLKIIISQNAKIIELLESGKKP